MTTLTEIVAAVVVHSSTAALSHFGVTLEPAQTARSTPVSAPAGERVIARTPQRLDKVVDCPIVPPRTRAAGVKA